MVVFCMIVLKNDGGNLALDIRGSKDDADCLREFLSAPSKNSNLNPEPMQTHISSLYFSFV